MEFFFTYGRFSEGIPCKVTEIRVKRIRVNQGVGVYVTVLEFNGKRRK